MQYAVSKGMHRRCVPPYPIVKKKTRVDKFRDSLIINPRVYHLFNQSQIREEGVKVLT